MYSVYQIKIKDIIYIGYTNDHKRRLREHIYACYNSKSNAYDKIFYSAIRSLYGEKEKGKKELKKGFKVLYSTSRKTEAKRLEMYYILDRYFKNKVLYQKVPQIRDM